MCSFSLIGRYVTANGAVYAKTVVCCCVWRLGCVGVFIIVNYGVHVCCMTKQQLSAMRWFFFFCILFFLSAVGHHLIPELWERTLFFVLYFIMRAMKKPSKNGRAIKVRVISYQRWFVWFWILPCAQVFDRDWESPRKIASLLYFRISFKEAFFVWRFDSSLLRTWYARLTEWNQHAWSCRRCGNKKKY